MAPARGQPDAGPLQSPVRDRKQSGSGAATRTHRLLSSFQGRQHHVLPRPAHPRSSCGTAWHQEVQSWAFGPGGWAVTPTPLSSSALLPLGRQGEGQRDEEEHPPEKAHWVPGSPEQSFLTCWARSMTSSSHGHGQRLLPRPFVPIAFVINPRAQRPNVSLKTIRQPQSRRRGPLLLGVGAPRRRLAAVPPDRPPGPPVPLGPRPRSPLWTAGSASRCQGGGPAASRARPCAGGGATTATQGTVSVPGGVSILGNALLDQIASMEK